MRRLTRLIFRIVLILIPAAAANSQQFIQRVPGTNVGFDLNVLILPEAGTGDLWIIGASPWSAFAFFQPVPGELNILLHTVGFATLETRPNAVVPPGIYCCNASWPGGGWPVTIRDSCWQNEQEEVWSESIPYRVQVRAGGWTPPGLYYWWPGTQVFCPYVQFKFSYTNNFYGTHPNNWNMPILWGVKVRPSII